MAREKCPRSAGRRTTRRSSFPSVRNPCERAGVSRFSAAALAPPLNKIDLEKKKMERKKKKAKPRGDSPHPPCKERPPTPPGPWAVQPGPTQQSPVLGGTRRTPGVSQEGGDGVPEAPLAPSPFARTWPLRRRPAPTHPSCHRDLPWGRAVATQISPVLWSETFGHFFIRCVETGLPTPPW